MKLNPAIMGFIKKELTQALRDPRLAALIFLVPIIQLTIFGLAISSEVKNIRLTVVSRPGDYLARRIEERAGASGWFSAVRIDSPAAQDYAALLREKRTEAVVAVPPEGLSRALERGDAKIQLLIDAANASRARQVEAYVKNVIALALADNSQAPPLPPVKLDLRVLYNPSLESAIFLVPGIMAMILCIITVIVTSMAIARERETGTFETLISAPVSTGEILAGKTVPYILLGLAEIPIIIAAAVTLFGVPLRGSLLQLAGAGFIFVSTTVMVGVLISTFAQNQQQAMMGGFIFLFPALLLSGVMFPVENIPEGWRLLAYLNPLMYFAKLLRNIMLKGGDWGVFWTNIGALCAIGATIAAISAARFKARLN